MSEPDDLDFAEEPADEPSPPAEPEPLADPFPNTPDPTRERQQPDSQRVVKPQKSGCGKCCLFGCLGMLALLVVGAVGLYLAAPYIGRWVLETYTDTKAATVPEVDVTARELDAVKKRVEGFGQAVEQREGARTLRLSARDINALLSEDPALKEGRLKLYVTLEDDKITGQISVPIRELPDTPEERQIVDRLGLQDRYLNGTVSFKVRLRDGKLEVFVDRVAVKGRELPDFIMRGWRKQNLAGKLLQQNPDFAASLEKIDSVEIKDGVLTIRSKAPAAEPEAPGPPRPAREGTR